MNTKPSFWLEPKALSFKTNMNRIEYKVGKAENLNELNLRTKL